MIDKLWKFHEMGNMHELVINGVFVACIQATGKGADREWEVYDYDTDFATIFSGGHVPEFDTVEEAKMYCNIRFIKWLQETNELLKDQ